MSDVFSVSFCIKKVEYASLGFDKNCHNVAVSVNTALMA